MKSVTTRKEDSYEKIAKYTAQKPCALTGIDVDDTDNRAGSRWGDETGITGEAATIDAGVPKMMSSSSSSVTTVNYSVTYCQTNARSMLDMINDFRTGGDAWYWNEDDTEKIYLDDLDNLTYDYDLEKIAMQRAAEIAIYYSHTRPDDEK